MEKLQTFLLHDHYRAVYIASVERSDKVDQLYRDVASAVAVVLAGSAAPTSLSGCQSAKHRNKL